MKMHDTLDKEKYQYNLSGYHLNHGTKMAMQSLYRNQLDEMVTEKKKQKDYEKQKQERQKKQYNQLASFNQESQKIKQQAYKNYYTLLLNNQQQMQSSYVSPYSLRDSLKDQHIIHAVQEGQEKNNQKFLQERRREEEKKNLYKAQLRYQLDERQKNQIQEKQKTIQEKEEFRRHGRSPNELKEHERNRQLEEMAKYRSDLDKVTSEKNVMKAKSFVDSRQAQLPLDQHNPLINPVPFNVQNPYIRRQMERQSYFARVANQNFSSP